MLTRDAADRHVEAEAPCTVAAVWFLTCGGTAIQTAKGSNRVLSRDIFVPLFFGYKKQTLGSHIYMFTQLPGTWELVPLCGLRHFFFIVCVPVDIGSCYSNTLWVNS